MKLLFQIYVIFLSVSTSLHAQYEGGDGDGASSYWLTDIRLDGLFLSVVYNGGIGDGADIIILLYHHLSIFLIFILEE